MAKDARPFQPQQVEQEVDYRPPYQHVASTRALRAMLIGAGIALVLTGIEVVIWLIVTHRLPAFLWILLIVQLVVFVLLALVMNKPLALSRYAREVAKATARYRAVYTPLSDWLTLYTATITCYLHSPDPTIPERAQELSLLDLVRPGNQFLIDPQEHLVLLGTTGAGKTTVLHFFQFMALLRRRPVIFGHQKIPIYIPLRNYNLFLRTHAAWYAQEAALQPGITRLLDFLATSDLPGIQHIRPYLRRLADQGRLLLLYDGLHDIEESYLPDVIAELGELMSQSRSRVIVACRPEDYMRQPQLAQSVEANLVARAVVEPLTEEQARSFVERYIESENSGKKWRHTAGQIMDMIANTRLRTTCSTSLLMLALLSVIDSIGIERGKRLDTRGRLMRAYTAYLISQAQQRPAWQKHAPSERDVLLFLGEIATAARWSNTPLAIQLHEHEHLLRMGQPTLEEHAAALQSWLGEHIDDMFLSDNLHDNYSRIAMSDLLAFALDAALLEISPHGILSFRHEMLAAYAVAEYFVTLQAAYDTPLQPTSFAGLLAQAMKRSDTTDAYARWSLPLALWAGLLDDPLAQAQRFVEYGRKHPGATLDTLALSLLCLGVASAPPYVAHELVVAMPPGFEEMLHDALRDGTQRVALARAITRYAEEDAQEIYQTLFLLLMLPDIDELIILLDMEVVPALLFSRLREIVDDSAYDAQVKRLARVIGHLGAVAVPPAAALSKTEVGRSPRLRSAAINILGGTGEPDAVDALNACLYDQDPTIVARATNAMIRLGPELTLPSLVEELENLTSTSATTHIHAVALRIIEHFLMESDPVRQLTDEQHQLVMGVLSHILHNGYAPEIQQKASEMLVRQARAAEESTSGELAVDVFIHSLASNDEQIANGAARALREIGASATPALLKELRESPPPGVTARIVSILGSVRDPRAMSSLLRLLADPSPIVLQQVGKALQLFAPESIPGLIYQVLQGEDDLVATGAEQILGDIGEAAVEPVIEALMPVVPERTHLLVRVLARAHDMAAVPTLIALLETEVSGQASERVDQQLVLALIDALGQFQHEQVVAPLIDMLASANPLFYEGAVNALSNLGDVAFDALLNALDVGYDSAITSRIERALLGMSPFPGERLLDVYAWGSDAQARHVTSIFAAKGPEAAQLLVSHLVDDNPRVQGQVREAVGRMPGQVIVPALLEVIDHPDSDWRTVAAEYLLRNPQEAIPPLVSLLDDSARGADAQALLLEFGPAILPALISGLDSLNSMAHERARALVAELARQSPQALASVVQLFAQTPRPPQRARETLVSLLARELAGISVPVLLDGLEDAHLVGDVSEILINLVRQDNARSEPVLDALLDSLRMPTRRHGAEITLIEIGAQAVPGVGSLVTDDDPAIAQSAQNILCEMGTPAFSFIWAAHSDVNHPERREAARAIFRRMPTVVIKDELVQLLSSDSSDDITMALTLLLERIHDEEDAQSERERETIPVLLEYAQTHSDQRASLRILALLLLLGGRAVTDYMAQVLYDFPNHSRIFLYAFLLLGGFAEDTLLEMMHDSDAPPLLRAETAGILGMLAPRMDIREYAKMLVEFGMWAGQSQGYTDVLQVDQLNIALRALGGLLAGGHWHAAELQQLRAHSKESSPERELYDILLGWRYSPYIDSLEKELNRERDEHKKHIAIFSAEILALRNTNSDLEGELQGLHHEHGKRGKELEEATQTADELSNSLERATQDKQSLRIELQQLMQEREQLLARNAHLEQIIDQLQE